MKLTKEEVEQITTLQTTYNNISNELGVIELQLFNLNSRKDELKKEYFETQSTENKFLESIYKKYGEGNIDLETKSFNLKEQK